MISDNIIIVWKVKIIVNMVWVNIDYFLVYVDKEYGGNFEYLIGFIFWFEEVVLVLYVFGKIFLLLGNENLKLF